MDVIRSLTRRSQIGYHVAEAEAWLDASENGARTTLLAYAAFELRLEIERIALELLARIRGDQLLAEHYATIRSFDRMERRIYDLEGHQLELDLKVAFLNVLLEQLKLETRIQPINLGRLRRSWHECSELCHVSWSLLVDSPNQGSVIADKYLAMSEIRQFVRTIVDNGIGWPRIADPTFADLQARYVARTANDDDVRAWARERGIYATETKSGVTEFVGVPVPRAAG